MEPAPPQKCGERKEEIKPKGCEVAEKKLLRGLSIVFV